jgi:hypothetical protein
MPACAGIAFSGIASHGNEYRHTGVERSAGRHCGLRGKIKVMNENLEELQQMAQDALEDAILMGCDEAQVKDFLVRLMQSLHNPYQP